MGMIVSVLQRRCNGQGGHRDGERIPFVIPTKVRAHQSRRLEPGRQLELPKGVLDVLVDCPGTDAQAAGDFLGPLEPGDGFEALPLARGQAR
jgi:hypothetical protein